MYIGIGTIVEQLSSLKEWGRVKGGYKGVWGIGGRA